VRKRRRKSSCRGKATHVELLLGEEGEEIEEGRVAVELPRKKEKGNSC
jgi:hypothetical protein